MRCITQDSLEKQNRTHTDVTEDIRTSLGVQWLRPDLSFQCRGHRFDSFSGNLQAEWCGQKKKREIYMHWLLRLWKMRSFMTCHAICKLV